MKEHMGKWWWAYALIVFALGVWIGSQWNNWFGASTGRQQTCPCPDGTVKFECCPKTSERIVYDTEKCCKSGNPCNWSSSTYNRVCGA